MRGRRRSFVAVLLGAVALLATCWAGRGALAEAVGFAFAVAPGRQPLPRAAAPRAGPGAEMLDIGGVQIPDPVAAGAAVTKGRLRFRLDLHRARRLDFTPQKNKSFDSEANFEPQLTN